MKKYLISLLTGFFIASSCAVDINQVMVTEILNAKRNMQTDVHYGDESNEALQKEYTERYNLYKKACLKLPTGSTLQNLDEIAQLATCILLYADMECLSRWANIKKIEGFRLHGQFVAYNAGWLARYKYAIKNA
ncbi:MAG TPA: hypothetical protein VGW78_05090 [Candidatus Babeliales bacterium]|jgi:hypothetical protein|nr:hypothetical protein [Candidatus Babeliales bacterium]